ncbi:unnamed protein product [Clonostachys rosea f. rosea IK726]|uniref:Uncharacterized protein n=2 Tax=Bionectria ochroleuca TaxID=29856 RepID=A0A0B7K4F1_BIOOC|nr:unnamed protein product [Clonostachys rosea f. rosea IK726]
MTGPLSLIDDQRLSVEAPSSVYPDLASYSSAASFNLPAHCDSSLLTPNSTAGSPLVLPGSEFRPQYPSPGTPHKELTPPDSTSMYPFQNQFEMNSQTSQSGSPMTQPTSTPGDFGESSYVVVDGRRTPNPPTEAYMGSFGVSDGTLPHGLQHQGNPFYMMQNAQPVDHMLRDDHSIPLDVPRNMTRSLPLHYHHVKSEPRDGDEPLFSLRSGGTYPPTGSPSRHSRTASRVRSRKRSAASRRSMPTRPLVQAREPVEENTNCHGEEVPPLLKDGCPAEERCIFESRWRHRDQKGQDMWNSVIRDHAKAFGSKAITKEKLQMKYNRGRSRWYQWLDDDENILRRAWWIVEKERYQTILNKFVELGGSRNMNASDKDIEAKLVELNLEQDIYIQPLDDSGVRRRRKLSDKGKRSFEQSEIAQGIPTRGFQNTRHQDEVIHQIHMQPQWEHGSLMTPDSIQVQVPERRAIKMEPGAAAHTRGAFDRAKKE